MNSEKCSILLLLASCYIIVSHGESPTNIFSTSLLKTLYNDADKSSNAVLSGISLYDVLCLLQQGARDKSLEELTQVLHADPETTRHVYGNITRYLKGSFYKSTVEFANKVYVQDKFDVNSSFQDIAVRDFQSAVETVDFSQNQKAADEVNAWVSDSTHGKITDLISSDAISADTVMILLNAVFFSGEWQHPFDEDGTKDSSFTILDGTRINVPTMTLSEYLNAAKCPDIGATYVHLPFQGFEFKMIVVVPNEVDGLSSVIDKLEQYGLNKLIVQPELRRVSLKMPKFKFESKFQLVAPLKEMGLNNIFSRTEANLRGIADAQLYVSEIVQKATIDVAEKGATAAAATGAVLSLTSLPLINNNELLEIVADHPFLFFIVDKENSIPLFSGWVGVP